MPPKKPARGVERRGEPVTADPAGKLLPATESADHGELRWYRGRLTLSSSRTRGYFS